MSTLPIGMIIEGLVAVLLLITIGYCWMLNRRLQRLRADEEVLRATISELMTATEIADTTIPYNFAFFGRGAVKCDAKNRTNCKNVFSFLCFWVCAALWHAVCADSSTAACRASRYACACLS